MHAQLHVQWDLLHNPAGCFCNHFQLRTNGLLLLNRLRRSFVARLGKQFGELLFRNEVLHKQLKLL